MNRVLKALYLICRIPKYIIRKYQVSILKAKGANIYIADDCILSENAVTLGDDVYIGPRCILQSAYGEIIIGNHVMFGPGVNIHCGNHKFSEKGRYMKEAHEKYPGEDGVITIEDDCWIGANAVILSNVTIGRGTVVGSGAIVTHDIPPYSIYTGVPEKKIRKRFLDDEIIEHEKLLIERKESKEC